MTPADEPAFRRVCVYCGSRHGALPTYRAAATDLGRLIVAQGAGLVYGGGSIGLMGDVADAVLEAGGHVIGVIPEQLATAELLHPGVPDMRVVDTMHTRKALMAELSDAFIALPGGLGTFEEFFETLTWAQLGIHRKPIGLLNVAGYFDPLLEMIDHAIESGFVAAHYRRLFTAAQSPADLWEQMRAYEPVRAVKNKNLSEDDL